jgi:hypothetical protein
MFSLLSNNERALLLSARAIQWMLRASTGEAAKGITTTAAAGKPTHSGALHFAAVLSARISCEQISNLITCCIAEASNFSFYNIACTGFFLLFYLMC